MTYARYVSDVMMESDRWWSARGIDRPLRTGDVRSLPTEPPDLEMFL